MGSIGWYDAANLYASRKHYNHINISHKQVIIVAGSPRQGTLIASA
ncbi:hypothetical protein [Alcanivorax sp. S71-1-4]|nr:hypothetical protein [Alcanivorax sp. S71-1-4]